MPFISQSCAHKICLICFLLSISTSTNPNFLDYCDCPPNLFYSGASTIHFSQQQKLPFKISSADSINFLPKTHQWLYNICRTKSQLLPPLPCRTGPHLLVSISCHSSSLTMLQRCPSTYPAAPPKDCCVCLFVSASNALPSSFTYPAPPHPSSFISDMSDDPTPSHYHFSLFPFLPSLSTVGNCLVLWFVVLSLRGLCFVYSCTSDTWTSDWKV